MSLRRWLSRGGRRGRAAIPAGQRVYAIGDIHGCMDALDALLLMIDADDADRAPASTTIFILGDFIDRGPSSAEVVSRLIVEQRRRQSLRVLSGNHEDLLVRAIAGDMEALRLLHRVGGRATFISYGMPPSHYDALDFEELLSIVPGLLPREHVAFLQGLETKARLGDYVFVHAGVRPGIAFEAQSDEDVRWIRAPFLSQWRGDGQVVVHGHTMFPAIDRGPGRLGIDTGAYATGVLTAVGIEGSQRWFLQTQVAGRRRDPTT